MTSSAYSLRYQRDNYHKYPFRVRKGTDLSEALDAYRAKGGSINWLITELMCEHFGVDMPHRYRFDREVTQIWPTFKKCGDPPPV